MRIIVKCALSALAASMLAGCSSGSVGTVPRVSAPAAITGNEGLSFAVGIARTASPGCASGIGLNMVATYRSANGHSAVLYDTPSVSGPPGFVGDQGSNTIYGAFAGLNVPGVSVGLTGSSSELGAFGYGFAAEALSGTTYGFSDLPAFDYANTNCLNTASGFDTSDLKYVGGAPAWPPINDGTFPYDQGFVGYSMGFFDYVSIPSGVPPLGTYTLNLSIPTGAAAVGGTLTGGPAATIARSASAVLSSQVALPQFETPTAVRDPQHPGGLLVTAVVPAGVTEAFAEIAVRITRDSGQVLREYYTLSLPVTTPGQPVTVSLPPMLGLPADGTTAPTPSVPAADKYIVYAVGFDYDALGPSYPLDHEQRPHLTGQNGQVDVTTSAPFTGT